MLIHTRTLNGSFAGRAHEASPVPVPCTPSIYLRAGESQAAAISAHLGMTPYQTPRQRQRRLVSKRCRRGGYKSSSLDGMSSHV